MSDEGLHSPEASEERESGIPAALLGHEGNTPFAEHAPVPGSTQEEAAELLRRMQEAQRARTEATPPQSVPLAKFRSALSMHTLGHGKELALASGGTLHYEHGKLVTSFDEAATLTAASVESLEHTFRDSEGQYANRAYRYLGMEETGAAGTPQSFQKALEGRIAHNKKTVWKGLVATGVAAGAAGAVAVAFGAELALAGAPAILLVGTAASGLKRLYDRYHERRADGNYKTAVTARTGRGVIKSLFEHKTPPVA